MIYDQYFPSQLRILASSTSSRPRTKDTQTKDTQTKDLAEARSFDDCEIEFNRAV